jgi:DNA-binding transcriptional LysR family regulator
VAIRAPNMAMQLGAARAGAGLVVLPCYIGDADRDLIRVTAPLAELDAVHWLVVHRDLRRAPRIRAVMDRIREMFTADKSKLQGLD